ncbi:MAG: hypothetical protein Gaeavirus34_2 [Gaeavirus sp.]|uniref:Uncharacterized protein n=1 Tax=Gaeavirus sp. TaxID=2487767 RepID=A0A3G4ZZJ1_9VIRU|nr:MAG: hypothetical protein Gaeavirus34_2 [Gaeavirus sp.]
MEKAFIHITECDNIQEYLKNESQTVLPVKMCSRQLIDYPDNIEANKILKNYVTNAIEFGKKCIRLYKDDNILKSARRIIHKAKKADKLIGKNNVGAGLQLSECKILCMQLQASIDDDCSESHVGGLFVGRSSEIEYIPQLILPPPAC